MRTRLGLSRFDSERASHTPGGSVARRRRSRRSACHWLFGGSARNGTDSGDDDEELDDGGRGMPPRGYFRPGDDLENGSSGVGSGMGPLADSHATLDVSSANGDDGAPYHGGSAGSGGHTPSSAHLLTGFITGAERVITVTARLRNTLACLGIYVALMTLNVFVMSWEVAGRGSNPVIIILECVINLCIIAEVTAGLYGLGRDYFRSYMNVVDFVLAVTCVGFFVIMLVTATQEQSHLMSEVDAVLLACRFAFQVLRLSVLAWRSRKAAIMQGQEEVDFNAVSLDACIDDETSSRLSPHANTFAEVNLRQHMDMTDDHLHDHATAASAIPSGGALPQPVAAASSYAHLKPSIYLELQNARAFGQVDSVMPPAADFTHPAAAGGGRLIGSASAMRTSPISSSYAQISPPPPVPRLSPPLSPDDPESAPASGPPSSTHLNGGGFSRVALHPMLAHDTEDSEDMRLHAMHQTTSNLRSALDRETAFI